MMLWGERTKTTQEVALEGRVEALERFLRDAERREEALTRDVDDLRAQNKLLRDLLAQAAGDRSRAGALDGEYLALTREVSGLRTTVGFFTAHVEAIAKERQELLGVLINAKLEAPQYEINMAPPTPGQEAVEGLGRAATAANVGDVLNRLRDQRDGIGVKREADDLGVFDDLGDPPLPE